MGNIGERIKEARLRNDWSQEELAKKMGYKSLKQLGYMLSDEELIISETKK